MIYMRSRRIQTLLALMVLAFSACGKDALGLHQFDAAIGLQSPVEVGIVNPQGNFLWLMSSSISCPGVEYEGGELHVNLRGLSGAEFNEEGAIVNRTVFTTPGRYELMVSDNLETELDNSYSRTFDLTIEERDIVQLSGGRAKKQCSLL